MEKQTKEILVFSDDVTSDKDDGTGDVRMVKRDPHIRFKVLKQLALIFVWICMGFYMEIVGPTLPDLKDKIGVDYGQISEALIFMSVGIMSGSLLSGFLHERFYSHSELLMAAGLLVAGISTISLPHVASVTGLAVCFYINGFTAALINIGGNTIVMHMWGSQAPAPIHSLHFGFGVGALLGPQVSKPFLASRNLNFNTTVNNNVTDISYVITSGNTSIDNILPVSRIEYAYLTGGVVAFVCFCLWVFIYWKGFPEDFPRRQGNKLSRHMFSPGSCADNKVLLGSFLLTALFVYYIQADGGQRAYGTYIFSFLVESELKFTESEAADVNSLYWGCFTLGRMSGIPTARFVSTPVMIAIQSVGILITCVILAIFVFHSKVVVWVMTVPLGYLMAQTYPSGMAWSNIYLNMNSVAVMVITMGSSVGGLIYQFLPGYLLEYYGQNTFLHVLLVYSSGFLLVFIIMQIFVKCFHGNNNSKDKKYFQVSNDVGNGSNIA